MSAKLIELLVPFYSVSIIGMAKNAGKTTVLNTLITQYSQQSTTIGLTSIGRDGENVDIVTNTHKPEIYVRKGTIIATAADLIRFCDITKEIILSTNINTPMGEVVFVRAKSDGFVQLGGASINSQIVEVCNTFRELGAQKVIVDGAISRKALSNPFVTDATILATGASLNVSISQAVSDTTHAVNMLTNAVLADEMAIDVISKLNEYERTVLIDENYNCKPLNFEETALLKEKIAYINIKGAVSDGLIDKLIMSNVNLKGVKIVAEDGSKLFLKQQTYDKLIKSGGQILTLNKINLVALTINPVSAYGKHYNKQLFLEKLRENVAIPVINVLDEEAQNA